jgi:hypothetical protein
MWNDTHLPAVLAAWTARDGCTGRIFSAYRVFEDILERPERHGFETKDPGEIRGGIWVDGLHATDRVHRILAGALGEFLHSDGTLGQCGSVETPQALPGNPQRD